MPKANSSTCKRKAYPIWSFHILSIIILVLLPTEFLHAPNKIRGTPMDLSCVRGLTYGREGLICHRQW